MNRQEEDLQLVQYLHRELPAEETARIQSRLLTESDLARRLMEISVEEATLMRWGRGEKVAQEIESAAKTLTAKRGVTPNQSGAQLPTDSVPKPETPSRFPNLEWPKWGSQPGSGTFYSLALAGLVGLGLIGYWVFASKGLAKISKIENVAWTTGQPTFSTGAKLSAETKLQIEKGSVEIEYANGTSLVLTGPATFQLKDSLHATLLNGQVDAYCPESAVGYTINTPSVAVEDRGTRFGVLVSGKKGTEVHVFDGEVATQIASPESMAKTAQTLTAQQLTMTQAARFDTQGKLIEWIVPDYDRFAEKRLAPGVVKTSENVRWLKNSPKSLAQGSLLCGDNVYLILESQNVELPGPIAATFQQPMNGTRSAYESNRTMLAAGLKVDSYLLHYNEFERKNAVNGEVVFDRPVIAVMARGDHLAYTDKMLGRAAVVYETSDPKIRGLKGGVKNGSGPDVLGFTHGQNGITIHCEAGRKTVAEVRILVQSK